MGKCYFIYLYSIFCYSVIYSRNLFQTTSKYKGFLLFWIGVKNLQDKSLQAKYAMPFQWELRGRYSSHFLTSIKNNGKLIN